MFISILYKFGSRLIYFSFSSVFLVHSLSLGLVLVRLGQHIRLVSFFVYFALLFSCTLHVRSLLVILCSVPCLLFCCFQLSCFLRVQWWKQVKSVCDNIHLFRVIINMLKSTSAIPEQTAAKPSVVERLSKNNKRKKRRKETIMTSS